MNNLPGDSRGLEPQVRTDTQELTGTGRRFDPGIGPRTGKKKKKCAACSVMSDNSFVLNESFFFAHNLNSNPVLGSRAVPEPAQG